MSKRRIWLITIYGLVIFTGILSYTSAFSMSEGYSSSSGVSGGLSSSLGFSSETLIMTGGSNPTPTVSPNPLGSGGTSISALIPPQWQPGTRSGTYYDPVTQTSWFFDNVLQKYYSPTSGWFMISQVSKEGKILNMFYYDPKLGIFYDMATGKAIIGVPGSNTGSAVTSEQQLSGQIPVTGSITTEKTITPSSGEAVITSTKISKPSEKIPFTSTTDQTVDQSSLISCPSCPSGYCEDSNHNGNCDYSEDSKTADNTVVTQQEATSSSNVNQKTSSEGGLSEKPQASVLYYKELPKSGIVAILSCKSDQKCDYCLDVDNDGNCTTFDYAIIKCGTGWGLDQMLSKDGNCDNNIIFNMKCPSPAVCKEAQYCIDENLDGKCDDEGSEAL